MLTIMLLQLKILYLLDKIFEYIITPNNFTNLLLIINLFLIYILNYTI